MGNGFSVTDPLQLSSTPGLDEHIAANPQIGLIQSAIESIPVLSRGEKAVNAIIAATKGGRKRVVHSSEIYDMAASRAIESQKGRSKKNGMQVSMAGGCSDCNGTCKKGGIKSMELVNALKNRTPEQIQKQHEAMEEALRGNVNPYKNKMGGSKKGGAKYTINGIQSGPLFDAWQEMASKSLIDGVQPAYPIPAPQFNTGGFAPWVLAPKKKKGGIEPTLVEPGLGAGPNFNIWRHYSQNPSLLGPSVTYTYPAPKYNEGGSKKKKGGNWGTYADLFNMPPEQKQKYDEGMDELRLSHPSIFNPVPNFVVPKKGRS